MKPFCTENSTRFLLNASFLYQDKCPELSRQFPFNNKALQKPKNSSLLQKTSVCWYCYQFLKPDNHRVRLRPKRRPSARVQRILRRARGRRLSLVQKRLLLRFRQSSSVLMATCHACSKTSRHRGVNRDFLSTIAKSHSTPGSASKNKTPQSSSRCNTMTPRPPGKSPANTPRSSISSNVSGSSSTSSKSSSKPKNWVVQRLSKILLREDNQGGKKGGLKDFLSSL